MLQVMRLSAGLSDDDLSELPGKLVHLRTPAQAQALSIQWDSSNDDFNIFALCDPTQQRVAKTFLFMLSEEPMEAFIGPHQSIRYVGSCEESMHDNMWHCFEVIG